MAAAGKGRLEEASLMVSAGADPMMRSRDGSTARDWAVKFGHSEVADFLESHMQVIPCCSSKPLHVEHPCLLTFLPPFCKDHHSAILATLHLWKRETRKGISAVL